MLGDRTPKHISKSFPISAKNANTDHETSRSTGSIEQAIASHPTIAECCVVGIPDALKGHLPFAFVTLSTAEHPESAIPDEKLFKEIQSSIREQIGAIAALGGAIVSHSLDLFLLRLRDIIREHTFVPYIVLLTRSIFRLQVWGVMSFSAHLFYKEHLISASSFMGVIPAIELCFPSQQHLSTSFPPSTITHPHPPTNHLPLPLYKATLIPTTQQVGKGMIPKTRSGKTLRRVLRELVENAVHGDFDKEVQIPATVEDATVVEVARGRVREYFGKRGEGVHRATEGRAKL
jgi:acyl-CoA synthetase (AMP-forming)/AMP-acid ligase II